MWVYRIRLCCATFLSADNACYSEYHFVVFTEVASWTIDLPEVRKYHFEKTEKYNRNKEVLKDFNKDQRFFDNIVPDSPHNREQLEHEDDNYEENNVYSDNAKYAEDYEYLSYMEKKVHGIVQNGSIYLEGLRRALEEYGELLKNCDRLNLTQPQSPNGPWLPQNERPIPGTPTIAPLPPLGPSPSPLFPDSPMAAQQPPVPQFTPSPQGSSDPPQGINQPNIPGNQPNRTFLNQPFLTGQGLDRETCERATRASEQVRRLAELATWATRELQDKAYAAKYEKKNHDEEEEEMELLIRLAFFLDRLAYYTGYEPNARDYITPEPTRAPTSTLPPISPMGDIPDDVKKMMMECLNAKSDEPAPDRCRFPLRYPEWMRNSMNITDTPGRVEPLSTESPPNNRVPSYREVLRNPSSGLRRMKREATLPQQKMSTSLQNSLTPEVRQKRSEDPLLDVMKYYVKHKVWTNSNPGTATGAAEFDVGNLLPTVRSDLTAVKNDVYKSVQKRSIDHKKYSHLRLPENPAQDISSYVKHRSGVNYIKDDSESAKIRQYLDKIRHSDRSTAKKLVQKLEKTLKSVQKRSIKPERKFLPSRSQDPSQDISYYVKNKPGTRYEYNPLQVAQARAGLEQVFQTGNIAVVQRFGSNYNPLIPFPLGAGVFRSFYTDL
ncbi:uncharacterized protein LOC126378775 isoform X2 [Pectinophora gossypiella]|uniref:uncharacterized protein LOC126378775 isoform X2 n=1 Tax=Pectinophora gossypiella TaxID=13191 RepID=UPI00214E7A3B|nr:uncharacterized protein LOC126378775 isoform X2 [Pectinophora gossypiella]